MDKDRTDSAETTPAEQSASTSSAASNVSGLQQQMLNQQSFNTTEVSLQHLKTSIIREVLATLTPEAIPKAIGSATTGGSDYRPVDDGNRKRQHPDNDEDDDNETD